MQSYEHHVVHESLEMRHPYIQDPFSSDIDPAQVSLSSAVPKLSSLYQDYLGSLRQDDL